MSQKKDVDTPEMQKAKLEARQLAAYTVVGHVLGSDDLSITFSERRPTNYWIPYIRIEQHSSYERARAMILPPVALIVAPEVFRNSHQLFEADDELANLAYNHAFHAAVRHMMCKEVKAHSFVRRFHTEAKFILRAMLPAVEALAIAMMSRPDELGHYDILPVIHANTTWCCRDNPFFKKDTDPETVRGTLVEV